MKYITGQDRAQINIFPICLDASIAEDNEVRFIDIFVESLDLAKMGFRSDFIENGRAECKRMFNRITQKEITMIKKIIIFFIRNQSII